MGPLQLLSETFKAKYMVFVNSCDAIENIKLWDKEQDGEMDGYFQNDLVSIIINLIAVDGKITDSEVDCINDIFGFDYSVEKLKEVYELCKDGIDELCNGAFGSGVKKMKTINVELANLYSELLELVCDIVSASDGEISTIEVDTIMALKAQCR